MAVNRYRETFVKRDEDTGFEVQETTIYPKVIESDDDFYYMTKSGDRMDMLAYKFYNDPTLWVVIMQANKETGIRKDSLLLMPGIQLRIPLETSAFFNDLNNINT